LQPKQGKFISYRDQSTKVPRPNGPVGLSGKQNYQTGHACPRDHFPVSFKKSTFISMFSKLMKIKKKLKFKCDLLIYKY